MTHVVDIAIGYGSLLPVTESNNYPEDVLSLKNMFLRGKGPLKVFMHVKVSSIETVLGSDDWITKRFFEKDALLDKFYKNKEFVGKSSGILIQPSLRDWLYVVGIVGLAYTFTLYCFTILHQLTG